MNQNELATYHQIVLRFPDAITDRQREPALSMARTIAKLWNDDLYSSSTARSLENDLIEMLHFSLDNRHD